MPKPLNEALERKIRDAIINRGGDTRCRCGNDDKGTTGHIHAYPYAEIQGEDVRLDATTFTPVFTLTCLGCGRVEFFDLTELGIMDPLRMVLI